ncbi:polyprenyl synthetase family protein [Marinigracilibium pacificum]|uniref:Polyprenyl synthetase family protein n=1 Tax=Marinigracilibium pacificum TaxID=2729599 RepID=A0A848J9N5_9BACT|nr:polyprenyl synthetase family protein [Marinigracilibium pacificum]NMM49752.1 polyprenyl synthetase family protein [Marinigracilibium pacificum]
MIEKFNPLLEELNKNIDELSLPHHPVELYDPIKYIMNIGGKRMRPLLTLLGYKLFADDYQKAMPAAMAVELFHNFTLVHDDIMDEAPLRRGKPTVHNKWNQNIGILSGDVMLVKVYDYFLDLDIEPSKLKSILGKFNVCAAEVCEGQQEDMNFETSDNVSESEYLEMIRKKTSVLLGFALEAGAEIAGATEVVCRQIRDFGVNLGIGFQLQDDLMDVYADQAKFGKQVGGDIIANKKTMLLIEALKKAQGEDEKELNGWLKASDFNNEEKVKAVTAIYDRLDIRNTIEERMNDYFSKAFNTLDHFPVPENKKDKIRLLAEALINRES